MSDTTKKSIVINKAFLSGSDNSGTSSTIQNKNMSEQKEILTDTFNNWTKGYEQTDDVLVIGIKID